MKRWTALVLVVVMAGLAIASVGCKHINRANLRYNAMQQRAIRRGDLVGLKEDTEAVFLEDRPSRLSQWYIR